MADEKVPSETVIVTTPRRFVVRQKDGSEVIFLPGEFILTPAQDARWESWLINGQLVEDC